MEPHRSILLPGPEIVQRGVMSKPRRLVKLCWNCCVRFAATKPSAASQLAPLWIRSISVPKPRYYQGLKWHLSISEVRRERKMLFWKIVVRGEKLDRGR